MHRARLVVVGRGVFVGSRLQSSPGRSSRRSERVSLGRDVGSTPVVRVVRVPRDVLSRRLRAHVHADGARERSSRVPRPSRPRAGLAPSSAADASGAGAVIDATSDDPGAPFADIQGLHPHVVDALARLGFDRATGIQSRAVPAVQSGADVVVAAETGSGKTLSYLVPVFSNLLHHGARAGSTGRLGALILAPNATLVEQVTRVARSLVDDAGEPLLRVAALTPETSMPFQLPDVVVATP